MNSKSTLIPGLAVFAATSLAASAVSVVVDNYITEPNGDTAGAVANFAVQSFTPSVAGLGVNDTVAANSPLPGTVYLESANFLKAVSGSATAGSLFINVYQGAGNGGTFLGSSTNTVDVESATGLDSLVWNFANLAMDPTSQVALVFSTTATDDSAVIARVAVARDSGGGFGNSYTGGTADDNADNGSPSVFDARFAVQFNTVPEPSIALLGGLGLLGLLRRRRA
jgi:hypothetical protein